MTRGTRWIVATAAIIFLIAAAPRTQVETLRGHIGIEYVRGYTMGTGPIALIELGDFESPYCGRFHANTFPIVEKDLIESNAITFSFVDYPLATHPQARLAADIATCASQIDLYWKAHNLLFDAFLTKTFSGPTVVDALKPRRRDQFLECVEHAEPFRDSRGPQLAKLVGLWGTPTFVIGTIGVDGVDVKFKINGSVDAAKLEKVIADAR